MIRTLGMFAMAAMVSTVAAAQTPRKPTPKMIAWTFELQVTRGTGISCATAMKYPDEAVHKWVEGFWSGLNMGSENTVGRTTDNAGMFAEVTLDCQKSPSDNFLHSVYRTWNRMKAAGK